MFNIKNLFKKTEPKTQANGKRNFRTNIRPSAYLAGETNRHTYSWGSYKYTSDEIIAKYYPILVARSCEQCMNNPYARKFLLMLKNNVVGADGIKLNSQAQDIDGKLDKSANEAIENAWEEWGKNCEITGKLNWIQVQTLVAQTVAREGEALIRMIKGKYAEPWGFALQLIDPRRLDIYKNENNLTGGNFIRFGIEFSPYGKPLNYYLTKNNLDIYGVSQYSTGDKYDIVPVDEILHIFDSEFIDQKRGLPWFSSVLMRMNMLAGYEEAAIEYARAAACQMGFIQNKDVDNIDPDDDTEINIEASPATFVQLPAGYEVKEFNPSYPNGEFDPFSKAILRGISSGIGASYNTLANDLTSVNFSSLRQGALDERDSWKYIQKWLASKLHEPIFQEWLKYSLLFGKIKINTGKSLPPEKIEKYKAHSWQPRSWQWVDPVKDVNAAIASIDAGLRSRSDVIKESGKDPEDVWTEIEQDNKTLSQKSILVKSQIIQEGAPDATSQ